jgi:hypothetical protein
MEGMRLTVEEEMSQMPLRPSSRRSTVPSRWRMGPEMFQIGVEAVREIAFRGGAESSGVLCEFAIEDFLQVAGKLFWRRAAAVLCADVEEGRGSAVVALGSRGQEAEECAPRCVADVLRRRRGFGLRGGLRCGWYDQQKER